MASVLKVFEWQNYIVQGVTTYYVFELTSSNDSYVYAMQNFIGTN